MVMVSTIVASERLNRKEHREGYVKELVERLREAKALVGERSSIK